MAQTNLTEQERLLVQKISANPLDLGAGEFRGWLEEFIRVTVGTPVRSQYVPGDLRVVISDLTAQTGVYVYEDDSGQWLYCNGAAASRTDYADLFALCGTSFGVGDGSTTFNLPDARGRSLFFTGTNAAANLGDNDGVSEASRTPVQSVSISGTTGSESSHTHAVTLPTATGQSGTGFTATQTSGVTSGAGSAHSHSFSGSSNVSPPHLFIGSLLVRF